MFVDASALVAILAEESDGEDLARRLQAHAHPTTSPLAVWEATVNFARVQKIEPEDALRHVEEFLAVTGIEVLDIPAAARFAALEAFARFGKGRHPAALNFGDCFAYACAKTAGHKLLCKGADFAQTDILRA